MTDKEDSRDAYRDFEAKIRRLLLASLRAEPLPPEVARMQQNLRVPDLLLTTADGQTTIFQVKVGRGAALGRWSEILASLPTPRELAEADEALRSRVLPGTSEEEVQKEITAIPDDPEKVKLVAFLTNVIEQATGVPGSGLWVIFLAVFVLAIKMNSEVVAALALAFAVLAAMKDG